MRNSMWLAAGAVGVSSLMVSAGAPVSWKTAASGNWNVAGNWDPSVVPGISDDVLIGLSGPFTVTVSAAAGAGTLDISNPEAMLAINSSQTMTLGGAVVNDGLILLNTTAGSSTTTLNFSTPGSLGGIGTMRLNNNGAFARVQGDFTQGAGHSIVGRGQIESIMVNNGLVSSDVAGQIMLLTTGAKTNNATMEAVNGATLRLGSVSVTQGPAGMLEANGAGSRLEFTGATVTGGAVRGVGGGVARVTGATTFDGVLLEGASEVASSVTVTLLSSLENHGDLTVNATSGSSTTTLSFGGGAGLDGSGRVILNNNSSFARIVTAVADTPLVHGAAHTIEGRGLISAALVNNGAVVANVGAAEIVLNTSDMVNNAAMTAIGGATLRMSGIQVDQSGGGELLADGAGSRIALDSAELIGGVLQTVNGGLVQVDSGALNLLDGVAFEGDMTLDSSTTTSLINGLTNNGTIVVNGTSGSSTTTVAVTGSQTLGGSGTLRLNNNGAFARITATAGATLTHAAGHTIEGRGQIAAPLINNGLIRSTVSGLEIAVISPTVTNNSTMRAQDGSTLTFNSTVTQPGAGLITAVDGSTVEILGGSITGGTLRATGTGLVRLNGTISLTGVDLEGAATITAARTITMLDGTTIDGDLVVNTTSGASTTTITAGGLGVLSGSGSITLNGNGSFARIIAGVGVSEVVLSSPLTLRGRGSLQSPTVIGGRLEPGVDAVGTMTASAPVTLQGTTVMAVEVEGQDDADQVDSSSTFAADGTLEVGFVNGFNPPLRWSAVIVDATGGVSGAFDSFSAPTPADPRLTFRVIYSATNIRIGAYCKADFNYDNALNFFDVSGFLGLYNAQDPLADMNNDGAWNFFDVSAFLGLYNSGCP